jgi:hypothetical protein
VDRDGDFLPLAQRHQPGQLERTIFVNSIDFHALSAFAAWTAVLLTTDAITTSGGSVHAALLAEMKAEGISLNQLCVAKLVAQLRAVV